MVLLSASRLVVIPLLLTVWWISSVSLAYNGVHQVSLLRWLLALILPSVMAIDAIRKKKLDMAGALTAFLMGIIMIISSYCFFLCLVVFFLSGSKLTKYRASRKKDLEENYKEGGQRTWVQVFANGGLPSLFAARYIAETGFRDQPLDFTDHPSTSYIALSVLCGIACCSGDTWASEIGSVVSTGNPFLITTWQRVPRGTNGGVSPVGTLVSFAGGLVVGLGYFVGILLSFSQETLHSAPPQWPVVLFGGVAGLIGSLYDSLLGACFQYSGFCSEQKKIVHAPSETTRHVSGVAIFDNEGVNLLSCLMTMLTVPHLCLLCLPMLR